ARVGEGGGDGGVGGWGRFFVGLVAVREGDGRGASSLFASAGARDANLAGSASDLLRLARRDGRLVLSALTEAGFDSNVELDPDGTPRGSGSADGYGALVAGVFARPHGAPPPYAPATPPYPPPPRIPPPHLGGASAAGRAPP